MKKIDKLILSSFMGPFFLTFFVVVFILLNINMIKYFDDLIGKGLGGLLIINLLYYFAVFTIPTALPLAVLLSSLITFGNLGEHFELTAVKSLGISLTRSLIPIFIFILGLTGVAFYANNYWVPKAALEAYSLLYDIKQKKPALDLREGSFYSGIPDISIKINKRLKDDKTILGVIIYDHRGRTGNKDVTVADSGKMYTIFNEQYLKLELFNGYNYSEGNSNQDISGQQGAVDSQRKTKFDKTQVVFDLSSFAMGKTDKKWFQNNRMMRNLDELKIDMDSLNKESNSVYFSVYESRKQMFSYFKDSIALPAHLVEYKKNSDSIKRAKNDPSSHPHPVQIASVVKPIGPETQQKINTLSDSLFSSVAKSEEITSALSYARLMKAQLTSNNANLDERDGSYKTFHIQWHKIWSSSQIGRAHV